jgi:serine/threonine protein kinase
LIDSICSGIYTYDNEKWNSISDEAKDLIDKLLVVDVEKRLTAEKAL